jgi:DNA-binding response OmpR family regulator
MSENAHQMTQPDPASRPAARAKPRVLIVEDEALLSLELSDLLRDAQFEVVGPVNSVERALEVLSDEGCDAAVLDINLGRETSERIASDLTSRGTPFVVMTGYSREQRPPAFNAATVLNKPLRTRELLAELRRCLAAAAP